MATLDDTAAPVAEKSVESSASAVEWASIFGGALAAFGVTVILLTLGPGLGLSTASPWSFSNPSPTTFGTAAAIWLVVTQWLSSAFGGFKLLCTTLVQRSAAFVHGSLPLLCLQQLRRSSPLGHWISAQWHRVDGPALQQCSCRDRCVASQH